MTDAPAPHQNIFLARMREWGHVRIPQDVNYMLDVSEEEETDDFVEALLEMGTVESINVMVCHGVFQILRSIRTHPGLDRLCEALRATRMSTVSLSGDIEGRDELSIPLLQQDELASTILLKAVSLNTTVRELLMARIRLDECFAFVLQKCSNLTHLELWECQAVDSLAEETIVQAFRTSNLESISFAFSLPLTSFEAHIFAAAGDFPKLKKLTVTLATEDRSEKVFFKDNHNTMESLTICFYDDRSIENASKRLGSTLDLIWESPIRIQSLRLVWGRLESLKDARTLLALVNSEERCVRKLWVEVETSVEVLALILRGLHRNTTLTSLKIQAPTTQGIGALFGDMLRHNNTLEELGIDCVELKTDDAAAIFSGLENNQSLKLLGLSADVFDLSSSNLTARQAPLHLALGQNIQKQGLESIREAMARGFRLTGLELTAPPFVRRAAWTRFFRTVGASSGLRTLRIDEISWTSDEVMDRWGDGLTALIDSLPNFRNLTDLSFRWPEEAEEDIAKTLVDAMRRNRSLEHLRLLDRRRDEDNGRLSRRQSKQLQRLCARNRSNREYRDRVLEFVTSPRVEGLVFPWAQVLSVLANDSNEYAGRLALMQALKSRNKEITDLNRGSSSF